MRKRNKNGLRKWLRKHKYPVIMLLFVILWVFVPPLIHFMNTTEAVIFPSFFGYVNSENADAWIDFYGAIIGGAITLLGFAWTIIDQNKKREEDMKDALKPVLVANCCKHEYVGGISDEPGTRVFHCGFEYKNVGKGILFDPMVYNIAYTVNEKKFGTLQPTLSVKSAVDIGDVADNSVTITFKPEVINSIMQSLKGINNTIPLQIIMYVGGKDMYGRDVVTKLDYKSELIFLSAEEIQPKLGGGTLTSKVLFSEEEKDRVIRDANPKYNVHR